MRWKLMGKKKKKPWLFVQSWVGMCVVGEPLLSQAKKSKEKKRREESVYVFMYLHIYFSDVAI